MLIHFSLRYLKISINDNLKWGHILILCITAVKGTFAAFYLIEICKLNFVICSDLKSQRVGNLVFIEIGP